MSLEPCQEWKILIFMHMHIKNKIFWLFKWFWTEGVGDGGEDVGDDVRKNGGDDGGMDGSEGVGEDGGENGKVEW